MRLFRLPINSREILPFVFASGLLMFIAYLLDDYSINPEMFGSNLPQADFFQVLGASARLFILPVLAGGLARNIGGKWAWSVGMVGGFLASTGCGGFLAAIFAGAVSAYITCGIKRAFGPQPTLWEGIKPEFLKQFLGILLIGMVMQLIINPLATVLNTWAFNALGQLKNPLLLSAVLGAMIGIDINGAFSQAAYVFATASMAGDQFQAMAAVMAGGMVLPLSVALSAWVFKKRFSKQERQFSIINILMGLAFLTDGAMLMAVEKPLQTIFAYTVGGSTAAFLSMLFHCTLNVPYGGIFVFPAIGNPLGFFAALCLGTILAMLILRFFRKQPKSD